MPTDQAAGKTAIHGVFSTQKSCEVGTGTITRKTVQKWRTCGDIAIAFSSHDKNLHMNMARVYLETNDTPTTALTICSRRWTLRFIMRHQSNFSPDLSEKIWFRRIDSGTYWNVSRMLLPGRKTRITRQTPWRRA
ncbi:MAG: hypothetical protein LBS77_02270 [Desulfovibrio sp.]|nr:hypothetical protein [Desulfovibrio sp.]